MANITIDYPDTYHADAVAALREYLGEDEDSLADAAAAKKAVKRWVKGLVRSYRRRNAAPVAAAVAAAESALADKESAAVTSVQARRDAEDSEDAAVDAAFGSDS